MRTAFAGERDETESAPQPVELSGADDARHPVPSVALPPVQEFLPGLCLPPSARRISQTAVLPTLRGTAVPLAALFDSLKGQCDGIAIADATALAVCDNKRIPRHKVFKGSAERGKTSMGWFYCFKLHAIINSKGELIRLKLTPGNIDDRKPMPELFQGLQLITPLKKNMKPVLCTDFDKAILRRRSLIETVFDELKNLCQIEHTHHRSHFNFVVNLMAGIAANCLSDNKSTLSLTKVNLLHSA